MKVALLSMVLAVVGIVAPVAAQAVAQSYQMNIPRQRLDAALKDLAQQTGLQIARFSDTPGGNAIVGPVTGDMSVADALHALLTPNKLTYKFVNNHTIAVVALSSDSAAAGSSDNPIPAQSSSATNSDGKEGKKSSSDGFRVAQVDQGTSSSSSSLDKRTDQASQRTADQLEQIIVTAQKRQERLQDVPISIAVLGGKDLDTSTYQGVTEALTAVPGVAAVTDGQGGGTFISVRGVSAASYLFSGSSPVAYYLDSIPFGLVDSAIAPDTNAYDLERVEVLRGPQGTLYGANALNGVVRVLTHDADLDQFELKGRTSGSSTEDGGGNYRGDVAINMPIVEGKVAARAVVEHDLAMPARIRRADEGLDDGLDRGEPGAAGQAEDIPARLRVGDHGAGRRAEHERIPGPELMHQDLAD